MPEASATTVRQRLEAEARRLGFIRIGVSGLEPFSDASRRGVAAVRAGRMEGMPWMTERRMEHSANPAWRFPWARSLVSLAWPYAPAPPLAQRAGRGRIAAYSCLQDEAAEPPQSRDYHQLLSERLQILVTTLRTDFPEMKSRVMVDHSWAIDRAVAERSGVGFSGKNTFLITREAGSYVLLAELLLSLELTADPPSRVSCGQCQACLPACPTGALLEPGMIDARRCISYLTIEHEGAIPLELRPLIGDWVFGCDLCQEACPINQRVAPLAVADPGGSTSRGPVPYPDLLELLVLDEGEFAQRFSGTPLLRSGRARLARNAAIALGNLGRPEARQALLAVARDDSDATVREAAGWALGEIAARGQEASATSGAIAN